MHRNKTPRTSNRPIPASRNRSALRPSDPQLPAAQASQLRASMRNGAYEDAARLAGSLSQTYPRAVLPWKIRGQALFEMGQLQQAGESLLQAHALDGRDSDVLYGLGAVHYKLGALAESTRYLEQALECAPDSTRSRLLLIEVGLNAGRYEQGLEDIARAEAAGIDEKTLLPARIFALHKLHRYEGIFDLAQKALAFRPEDERILITLADCNIRHGCFDEAESIFEKLLDIKPLSPKTLSSYLFSLHYNPKHSQDFLVNQMRRWDDLFPTTPYAHPEPDWKPGRPIRIGLLSAGFRSHPVGTMIVPALENLSRADFDILAYSTNSIEDAITQRIRDCCRLWRNVTNLDDAALAEQIRTDRIDILVDLCGHSEGQRMKTMAMKPAPLQLKWVGGLNNTTGLKAIDYLLSDSIETPAGVDGQYTEKLIRMPDDYVCYLPPALLPNVTPLPALNNGYVTFGCFNNPSKINDVTITRWSAILRQVPQSRLFLKGGAYDTEELRERLCTQFEANAVSRERLVFEGQSSHFYLLHAYNRVDIALDPWPYSGGLTTCEALLMGVPVVTYPGPSFAGRHSATHLTHAGLDRFVAGSWEHYESLAISLATDLANLAALRKTLRQQLLDSPVCDGPRFARNLETVLHAIWLRHCEGKSPTALTIDQASQAWFQGEAEPVRMATPRSDSEASKEDGKDFRFVFEGRIITLDHGALLSASTSFPKLQKLGTFATIVFDPASKLSSTDATRLQALGELHHYPHVALGNGGESALFACIDPAMTATLEPLPADQQLPGNQGATQVIAKLPITTLRLDAIEGLENIDWLVLDSMSDSLSILENGEKTLAETLLVQARVNFSPTHKNQPELTQISYWLARHGFSFYRLNNLNHFSHLPRYDELNARQATQLYCADALFVPNAERTANLTNKQRMKMAFVLHFIYGIQDLTYRLVNEVDPELARRYLEDQCLSANTNLSTSLQEQGNSKKIFTSTRIESADDFEKNEISTEISRLQKSIIAHHEAQNHRASLRSQKKIPVENAIKEVEKITLDDVIHVVDIGANPIDGLPPYTGLLRGGMVRLVGFEPQPDALQKLNRMKGPNEKYLPYAVGDGQTAKLYLCQAQGMTSTLKPNNAVLDHFQGYPIWGKVIREAEIKTVRLDDVMEVEKIDWLKIDIQGGELAVFRNGEQRLRGALVIQTEVNFIQLYENQPLFAEIDQWMRSHGFMLHALLEQRRRLYAPLVINNKIHNGINQLTTADAVYIREINSIASLPRGQRMKMAKILHSAYGSSDLAYKIMTTMERVEGSLSSAIDQILKTD